MECNSVGWREQSVRALDVRGAATVLGLRPATLYSKAWRGRVGLRAVKIGGSLRFLERDLYRLLEAGAERLPGHGRREEAGR